MVQEPSLHPQEAFRKVLAFAFSSGSVNRTLLRRAADRSGNGSAKRKGRIERQFSLIPIEGFLKTNVSKLFSGCDFFLVNGIWRNSEKFLEL